MAIRIRTINNCTIALCAAETDPKPGDIYLDDATHHALSTKFGLDFQSEGLIESAPVDNVLVELMEKEKVRDAKQEIERWAITEFLRQGLSEEEASKRAKDAVMLSRLTK